MKLIPIEGNSLSLDGGAMFGNVPKEVWKEWFVPDEKNRIRLASRALLYQTESGKNFLFESGSGAFFDPKMRERFDIENENRLLANLESQGIREQDIDGVVLTHLHFDHAGGVLSTFEEGKPRLLFPKAQYYLGKEHWERAKTPHIREKASFIPFLQPLLENCKRLILIEGNHHPDLGEETSFRYSNGHTVGLMLPQIQFQGKSIHFASDLIPGIAWVHLPVTMGYDRYPELLVNEKRILFEEIISKNSCLFFTHDPLISFATIHQETSGKFKAEPLSL